MASITLGPNGFDVGGNLEPTNQDFLASGVGNPLGALKETIAEQRVLGVTRQRYSATAQAVDTHIPMRGSTMTRLDQVRYDISVGYDQLANQGGVINITPQTSAFNASRTLLDKCGDPRTKSIASRTNINSDACNPSVSGPMPIVGHEAYGQEAFTRRLPIPPLCFGDYANKEAFHETLGAVLDSVSEATAYVFALDKYRWLISKGRFNAAPLQVSQGNGKSKLPVSDDLFTQFTFGHVPTHYGSFSWIADMLRHSELEKSMPLTVELPVSIFTKMKRDWIDTFNINLLDSASNLTGVGNRYVMQLQGDDVVYRDNITGRVITFKMSDKPVYVEVDEVGSGGGSWYFQEEHITRDSETANQVMTGRHNPAWGESCSCTGRVLCALISVTAVSNSRPFYTEPLPGNPDTRLRSLISRAASNAKVNTNLAEIYPSTVSTTILTGLDCEIYVLNPLNQRFLAAGWPDRVVSNLKNTHMGGYCEVSGVFVENKPRQMVNFLLKVPVMSNECVEFVGPCDNEFTIPTAGEFDPAFRAEEAQEIVVPDPPEAVTPPAGKIRSKQAKYTATANCVGSGVKTVTLTFVREGGSAGTLALALAATPSAHVTSGTFPTTVSFADGQTTKTVTFTVDEWASDPSESESFLVTQGPTNLVSGAFSTFRVCIKSTTVCPDACETQPGENCGSC